MAARSLRAAASRVLRHEHRPPDIFEYFDTFRPRTVLRPPVYQFRAAAEGRAAPVEKRASVTASAAPLPSPLPSSPMSWHVPAGLPSGMTEVDLQSGGFGADAFFVRADGIGVADGVSGWDERDKANSQLYARLLMHHAAAQLERANQFFTNETPQQLLEFAAAQTASVLGSSTALVATVQDDTLRLAQLGDCGALLVRNGAPIFRSVEQVHAFNFPYQLGAHSRDTVTDVIARTLTVTRNDLLIVGTDGLFDNLFDEEILELVRKHIYPWASTSPTSLPLDLDALAKSLVHEAYDASCDRRRRSPYELRAVEQGMMFEGGKRDDITVVVAVVVDSEDSPDRR